MLSIMGDAKQFVVSSSLLIREIMKFTASYDADQQKVFIVDAFQTVSSLTSLLVYSRDMNVSRFAFCSTDYFIRFLIMKKIKTAKKEVFGDKISTIIVELAIFLIMRYLFENGCEIDETVDLDAMYDAMSGQSEFCRLVLKPSDLAMAVNSIRCFKKMNEWSASGLVMLGFDPSVYQSSIFCVTSDSSRVDYRDIKRGKDAVRYNATTVDMILEGIKRVDQIEGNGDKRDNRQNFNFNRGRGTRGGSRGNNNGGNRGSRNDGSRDEHGSVRI